ncbi:MAG: flagellar basal body-associated FliL family protein [Rhizobiales bacterium]|nr:flagellar basal body-associated FliL family protein [Hyphomicrobiales bacterium]
MADKKAGSKENVDGEEAKKKSGLVPSIIAVVILSAIAVGAGWFVASQSGPSKMASVEDNAGKKISKKSKKDKDKRKTDNSHAEGESASLYSDENVFTKFEPFIVNLPRSGNSLIRLELGMLAESGYSITRASTQAEIINGISTYLKTVELDLYSGPSGYLHLREDLLERAQLISNGKVQKVFILSMAVE